jgi:Uma2 family endonuclease
MKLSADRVTRPQKKSSRGQPPWAIARLFPVQGEWTEDDYFALEGESGNKMIELVDGFIEVLPMPDLYHQGIVKFLFRHLDDFTRENKKGEVFSAPSPVRLTEGHLREPDIFLVKAHRIKDRHQPPNGADLVMEIVSPGTENRQRDLRDKRRAYAKAKIPEYWIVDPKERLVTVLTLVGKTYKVHGKFKPGDTATSKLLPGFTIDVTALFAAGEGP